MSDTDQKVADEVLRRMSATKPTPRKPTKGERFKPNRTGEGEA